MACGTRTENASNRARRRRALAPIVALTLPLLSLVALPEAAPAQSSLGVPTAATVIPATVAATPTSAAPAPATAPPPTAAPAASVPAPTGPAPTAPASTVPALAPVTTAAVATAPAPTVSAAVPPAPTGPGVPATPGASSATAVPLSSVAPTSVPLATSAPVPPPDGLPIIPTNATLRVGSRGESVQALETRLDGLRYDVGTVDGRFDWQTWQGVIAFQKLHGIRRTGVASPSLIESINASRRAGGLLPSGGRDRIEVDIGRQVMLVFKGGSLFKVVAVSSGSGRKYCEISKKNGQRSCGDARTPRGNFRIQRRISGWRESNLGKLYNPLYFNGGFAIHGGPSVPAYPASHGCVRIPMATAKWFPKEIPNGMPVYVFD